jgi:LAGLIDADG DNA endonuclease family protein
LDVYDSDNVTGDAENQQERLIEFRGWVIGFVDGEGCFSIGFTQQADRVGRRGYTAGYQVFHRFVVTQGERSRSCLEELQEFFGVGRIFVNRRHDNHREHLCQYHVNRRVDLLETIIPFFKRYPLRSSKQTDFEAFSRCMEIIASGRHLTREGLVDIAEIAQTMNHQKPRHELIRILRDHTPEALDTGS